MSAAEARARIALEAAAFACFAWLVLRFNFLSDDAFISFRYAKNLAEGHGLRFNALEEPPVEGYSNFLWVLLLGAFEALKWDVTIASRVVSSATGLALLALFARFLKRRVAAGGLAYYSGLFFLAALPPIGAWSTSGLDTMPFAACVFGAFERLHGDPKRPHAASAALLCIAAALLRADGLAWVAMVVASALVIASLERSSPLARAALWCAGAAVAATALHVAWRSEYYGYLLPNTARVKVGLGGQSWLRGIRYGASFLVHFPGCAAAFVFGLAALRGTPILRPVCMGALVPSLATFVYAALVGGDYMTMGRFLVPALPFLGVLFSLGLQSTRPRGAVGVGLAVVCVGANLLPAFDRHVAPHALRASLHFRAPKPPKYRSEYMEWLGTTRVNARLRALGKALGRYTGPGESITLLAVGACGYYSDLFIYDQWGLTNSEVATAEVERRAGSAGHDRGVPPSFFLRHKPTYSDAKIVEPDEVEALERNAPQRDPPSRVESHPLGEEEGGGVLVLFRILYAGEGVDEPEQ